MADRVPPVRPITHLLIDGDVVAFIAASAVQNTHEDSFGFVQPFANILEGRVLADNIISGLEQGLGADSYEVWLSDPESNWRHRVDPTYKGNRDPAMKPLLLGRLKQHLRDKHGAKHLDALEADDVLGILATDPKRHCGGYPDDRYIVVGRDKDFKSIPGLHHQWKDLDGKHFNVREVSQWEGDRFHLIQTLAGDAVDGYAGCPGIGMKRAEEIIDNPVILTPVEHRITKGKNKGQPSIKWMPEPTRDYWACIVSHYRKAGKTEEDALVTARLARILRHGEYDNGRITLWTPELLPKV